MNKIFWYLRKYLGLHKKYVFQIYIDLILSFNKKIFEGFFNLTCFLRRKDVRIEYLSSENIFKLKSNDSFIYISNKTRSLLYQNGSEETADLIGKDYLLQHIKFNNGDTIIDCGANVGDLFLFFKKKSININYIGFEPSPMEFKCLERNISGVI